MVGGVDVEHGGVLLRAGRFGWFERGRNLGIFCHFSYLACWRSYFRACGSMVFPLGPLLAAFRRSAVFWCAAAIPCGSSSDGMGLRVSIRSQVMVWGRFG